MPRRGRLYQGQTYPSHLRRYKTKVDGSSSCTNAVEIWPSRELLTRHSQIALISFWYSLRSRTNAVSGLILVYGDCIDTQSIFLSPRAECRIGPAGQYHISLSLTNGYE